MNLEEKTVKQTMLHRGRIVNLREDDVRLPNGNLAKREVVEHPGGVSVVALDELNRVLFVRQFRYPYERVLLEIPAGKLSPGEDPLECGKRELKEETGAVGEAYQSLGVLYPSPGYCDEIIYLYITRVTEMKQASPDEDEFLEVEKIPLETAVEMILAGQIEDAKTQTAVLKTAMLLRTGSII